MKKYIYLGPITIPSYALMIAIGCIFGIIAYALQLKKDENLRRRFDKFAILIPILFIGGLLGAAIFDKLAHFNEDVWYKPAGISFAGGLIAGYILYMSLYSKIVSKEKANKYYDLKAIVAPFVIIHAFGRIGCFMAGCCYGKPTNSIFGVTFPENSLQHQQSGEILKVFPTQLFEAIFLFILFLILFFFIKKYTVPVYFISYGVFRFFIEFLRGDNRGTLLPFLSPSQLMSIIFVIIGIINIFIYRNGFKNEKKEVYNNAL